MGKVSVMLLSLSAWRGIGEKRIAIRCFYIEVHNIHTDLEAIVLGEIYVYKQTLRIYSFGYLIVNNAKQSNPHCLPKRPGVDAPANVFFSAGKTFVHSVKLLMLLTPSMLSLT